MNRAATGRFGDGTVQLLSSRLQSTVHKYTLAPMQSASLETLGYMRANQAIRRLC